MAYPPGQAQAPALVMSPDDLADWWKRVELADQRHERLMTLWRKLKEHFLPPKDQTEDSNVNSNVHFRNTYLKIAEVYAQFPDLILEPLEPLTHLVDPATGQPFADAQGKPLEPKALAYHICAIKRAVLKQTLDAAKADLTIKEALFDIFQVSGVAATKICYEADIKQTEMEVPGAPVPAPGAVLGIGAMVPGEPTTQMVPVVVNERIRWDRKSPACLRLPHNWYSTDYDRAPYLMLRFEERDTPQIRQHYKIPESFTPGASSGNLIVGDSQKEPGSGLANIIRGIEIYFHASLFDPNEANFDVFYRLVLIEGLKDRPAIYELCPYQTIGPDGKLTADSMIGNPIHPITLRVATDMAWIPADAAFTDPLVKQENTYLQQAIKARDANIPRFLHGSSLTTAVDKVQRMDVGQGAEVDDAAMLQMDRLIQPLPHLENAASDVQGHAIIRRAMDETLGIGSNQAGAPTNTVRSATESAIVQQNVSVRLKGEQTDLKLDILAGVRKVDALVMRYGTPGYVRIVGQGGANLLAMFNRQLITGKYAYDATLDSMLTVDTESKRQNWLRYTNFVAKSPAIDQVELMRIGTQEFGYDAGALVKQPEPPPEPPPDKPKITFSFNGSDLAIPEVRAILGGAGIQLPPLVSPEAMAAHQAQQAKAQPHGGSADRVETLSKHHGEQTGKQDGTPPIAPAQPPPANPNMGLH